jgi:exo-beta-1,3-glucanase (GH17 family)
MSYRVDKTMSLAWAGVECAGKSNDELQDLFQKVLQDGMHGICFSLYEDGQKPGDIITEEQVRRRMSIIRPYTKWVRSFSCTDGNELVPMIAKEFGLKTLVGAWLGKEPEINEREMEGLIQLAKEGYVDVAAIGNEVLYRDDLSEDELLDFIARGRTAIPAHIPIGYVDAYYEFAARPRITEAVDVILSNCYPFWEGCACEYSLMYMKNMYYQAKAAGKGKRVIITETGWPSQGKNLYGAIPTHENARNYFINTQLWSKTEDIEIFYFSSFDESWKVGSEGDVGAYWGLWDTNENLKF